MIVTVRPGEGGRFLIFQLQNEKVWDYAKPVTPPVYVPYAADTFEDVWFRPKRAPGTRVRVFEYSETGVSFVMQGSYTFGGLLDHYEKLDGTPAGTLEK